MPFSFGFLVSRIISSYASNQCRFKMESDCSLRLIYSERIRIRVRRVRVAQTLPTLHGCFPAGETRSGLYNAYILSL